MSVLQESTYYDESDDFLTLTFGADILHFTISEWSDDGQAIRSSHVSIAKDQAERLMESIKDWMLGWDNKASERGGES